MLLVAKIRLPMNSYSGRREWGPEWPPSPYRLMCAWISAAHTRRSMWSERKAEAFRWLESLPPPVIIAPRSNHGSQRTFGVFVQNNDEDKVIASAGHKTPVTLEEIRASTPRERCETIFEPGEILYVWPIEGHNEHIDILVDESRFIDCLGQGHNHAICRVEVAEGRVMSIDPDDGREREIEGERWFPSNITGGRNRSNSVGQEDCLRVPCRGTYDGLEDAFQESRRSAWKTGFDFWKPEVPFHSVAYTREGERRVMRLVLQDVHGDMQAVEERWAITVAALLRSECMRLASEERVSDDVISKFVGGHVKGGEPRMSYVPMPSIGFEYTNEAIRRALICAPPGVEDDVFDRICSRIARTRRRLVSDDKKVSFTLGMPSRSKEDQNMFRRYTGVSRVWSSVTPVILPRHASGSKARKRKHQWLEQTIKMALDHAGYTGMIERIGFARNPFTHNGEFPSEYRVAKHMDGLPRIYMTVEFRQEIAGPVLIGSGRHCGLGVFAHNLR